MLYDNTSAFKGSIMDSQELISVIIPIYNMENYLARCLDSVCYNTYKNLEIICINDGSSDSSLEILKNYKKKDGRIIIIDQENKKVSATRNAGLEIAQGKWIAFIDPDDWVHPQYFEILLYVANKENAQISICDSSIAHENSSSDKLVQLDDIKYKTITKNELNGLHAIRSRVWGRLYRKDVIGDLRFISGAEPVEDECFNNILYSEQLKYTMTECKLYYYFMRKDSAIHVNTGRQSLVYTRYMIPLIAKENDPGKRQDMIKRCYNMLFASRYREMFSEDYKEIKKNTSIEFSKLRKYRKQLSVKDQLLYSILCKSPKLYRAWRIHDDPTLLAYEDEQKKKIMKNERRPVHEKN